MDKPKESPTLKQAHLQAAASPRSNQSLQKSLLCQRREKNKKISHASQKLNLPTNNLTLKLIDNQTNIDEGQITTAYNKRYKTLGFRWLFKLSAPHHVRCNLTGKSSAIPNDFIPPTVGGQFKKRQKLVKETINKHGLLKVIFVLPLNYISMILLDILSTLREYQVIGTIIVMVISGATFWFLIENRCSVIKTEIIEKTKEFKIGDKDVFIGSEIDLTVINKTTTISIIKEEPKIFLKYQFGFSELFKRKYVDITKYVKRTDDNTFPLEIKERKGRRYLKYTLTNDFFKYLSEDFSNPNILTISIYIQYTNDVTKKVKTTNKVKLNKDLYKYNTQSKLEY